MTEIPSTELPSSKQGLPSAKIFTLDEANSTIKLIIPALRRIQRMAETITLLGSVKSDNALVGTYKMQKELHKMHYDFFNHLDFLDEQGIIIKDPTKGEIEFPSSHKGTPIFFFFKLGQDEVREWYTDEDDTPRPISHLQ